MLTKDAYTEDAQIETDEHVDCGNYDQVTTCICKCKDAVVEKRKIEIQVGSFKSAPSTFVTKASGQTGCWLA